jgi:hypothetical protein
MRNSNRQRPRLAVSWAIPIAICAAAANAQEGEGKLLALRTIQPDEWRKAGLWRPYPLGYTGDATAVVQLASVEEKKPPTLALVDLKTSRPILGKSWVLPIGARTRLSLDGTFVWYTHGRAGPEGSFHNRITKLDVSTGKEDEVKMPKDFIIPDELSCTEVEPGRLYIGDSGNYVPPLVEATRLWDLELASSKWTELFALQPTKDDIQYISHVRWCADAKLAYFHLNWRRQTGGIGLYSAKSGALRTISIKPKGAGAENWLRAISSDGKRAYVEGANGRKLLVLDVTGSSPRTLADVNMPVGFVASGIRASPSEKYVVLDGVYKKIAYATLKPKLRTQDIKLISGPARLVCFSADERYALLSSADDSCNLAILELSTGKLVAELPLPKEAFLSASGRFEYAVARASNTCLFWGREALYLVVLNWPK